MLGIRAAILILPLVLTACVEMNGLATESMHIGKYQYKVNQKLFSQQGSDWVQVDGIHLKGKSKAEIKLDISLEVEDGTRYYKIENPVLVSFESSAGGQIEFVTSNIISYSPPKNFRGVDEITYHMLDDNGERVKGFLRIAIGQLGNVNSANLEVVGLRQGQSSSFNVLKETEKGAKGRGASVGGGIQAEAKITVREIVVVKHPRYGAVKFDNQGNFTYTPFPKHFGSDEFTYQISFSNDEIKQSTVRLEVDCTEVDCERRFSLSWDPSISEDIVGYRVYVGRSAGEFNKVFDAGIAVNFQFPAKAKGSYYFAVTAINELGIESSYSSIKQAVF